MAMENDDILIELATIASNGNEGVVRDVTLLVRQPEVFVEAYQEWYESVFADSADDDNADIVDVFISWLVKCHVGASIDVNAKPGDIVAHLWEMEAALGCSLHIDELEFTGDEKTEEFLDIVGTNLEAEGLGLYRMDADPDTFLLLVVRDENEDSFVRDMADLGLEGHMH